MTQRDWFALAVRLMGLYLLLAAFGDGLVLAGIAMDWWPIDGDGLERQYYFFSAAVRVVTGLLLVRRADFLTKFAFGEDRETSPTQASAGSGDETDSTTDSQSSL